MKIPNLTLKVNQLVEIEYRLPGMSDDQVTYLSSRIEEVTENRLHLAMPMRKGVYVTLRNRQKLKVIVKIKESILGFETSVLERIQDVFPIIVVEKPVEFFMVPQKRESVRLEVSLPVNFRTINPEIKEVVEGVGMTVDLSAGGSMFRTTSLLYPEDRLSLNIILPEIEPVGTIARIIRVLAEEKDSKRIAVSFEDISRREQDSIFKFIFKKQREWMKKGLIE